jgi:hypothetical protein
MSDALRKSVEEAQKVFERCATNAKAQRNNAKAQRNNLADDIGSYLILQAQFMAFDLAANHLKSILDTDADAEKLKRDLAKMSKPAEPLWRCANPTACGWSGTLKDAQAAGSGITAFCTPQCPKCGGPVVPIVGEGLPKAHPWCERCRALGLVPPVPPVPPASRDLTQCRRCEVVLPVSETSYHGAWDVLCESCFKTITAQKATESPKET